MGGCMARFQFFGDHSVEGHMPRSFMRRTFDARKSAAFFILLLLAVTPSTARTAETCPLPFCTTNPGKSCTTISDPNLSYFCGTQENKPFRKQEVKRAAAKEKKKSTATAETCPLPFCTTNPGKSCTTISDPSLSYFCGTQENKPFRKQ